MHGHTDNCIIIITTTIIIIIVINNNIIIIIIIISMAALSIAPKQKYMDLTRRRTWVVAVATRRPNIVL